jgi:hypothetical protein
MKGPLSRGVAEGGVQMPSPRPTLVRPLLLRAPLAWPALPLLSLAVGLFGPLAVGGAALAATLQVNTYTTSYQAYPSVAVDADGDFVVVWVSHGSSGSDTDGRSIQGQRYDAGGSAVGSEFQVNSYTTDDQFSPSVAVDADGDLVVVWASRGSAGSDTSWYSIQGQRYDASGSAVESEFQVNTYTTYLQVGPSVAVDADGDFVVVWSSHGSAGSDTDEWSVQGQRYDASGSAVGSEFQVNTYTTSYQAYPSVAVDADGDFVVVWESWGSAGSDTSYSSVQGQRYERGPVCQDGYWDDGEFCGYDAYAVTGSAEMNHDCVVDVLDFSVMEQQWGMTGPGLNADLNGDYQVDVYDYVLLFYSYGDSVSPCTVSGMLPDLSEGTIALSFSSDPNTIVSTRTQTKGEHRVYVVIEGWTDPEVLEYGIEASSNIEILDHDGEYPYWEEVLAAWCDPDPQRSSYRVFLRYGGNWPTGPIAFAHVDYELKDRKSAWLKVVPVPPSCAGNSRLRWAKAAVNRSYDFATVLDVAINGPAPLPALSPRTLSVLAGILLAVAVAVLGRRRGGRP